MSQILFQGHPIQLSGQFIEVGSSAPEFTLTAKDLSPLTLSSLKGKKVVLNVFPSIDTPVCAQSVRAFNQQAATFENTEVLCISADLPFAVSRFCELEGLERVQSASTFRSPEFGQDYGLTIAEGPLAGLMARAVIILNEEGKVIYTQLVAEVTEEPNYEAAIAAL